MSRDLGPTSGCGALENNGLLSVIGNFLTSANHFRRYLLERDNLLTNASWAFMMEETATGRKSYLKNVAGIFLIKSTDSHIGNKLPLKAHKYIEGLEIWPLMKS